MLPELPDDTRIELFRQMWLIRRWEERLIQLAEEGESFGHYHVYVGQESIGIPVLAALRPDDVAFTTHRNHGHLLGRGTKARAISAGTQPGEYVHPEVVQVMREEGIDLNGVKPQFLSDELARQATLLVTMGCGDSCPYVPGLKKLDWPLLDPKGQSVEAVRKIRDDIRRRVAALATERGWL